MTVRTWFTISIIVVIALFAAVALKLTAPVNAPSIVVRVGKTTRLDGARNGACWPRSNGRLRCVGADPAGRTTVTIPRKGTLRTIVAYPVQPKEGYISISKGRTIVLKHKWRENLNYDLAPGVYSLITYAKYPKSVFVQWVFSFRTR